MSPGGTPSLGSAVYVPYLAAQASSLSTPVVEESKDDVLIRPPVPLTRSLLFGTPSIADSGYVEPDDTAAGVNDSGTNVQLHDDLGASCDSLGVTDLGITHNSARLPGAELFEPSVTPPMRSANPIAMNSPFCYNTGGSGAEIGLLSFSPPSTDSLLHIVGDRRARLPTSTASEFSTRKRFGDAAPRGRPLFAGTSAPLDSASSQSRGRISHASEVF